MTLMENIEHTVRLLVDNVLRGNITIDWNKMSLSSEKYKEIIDYLTSYMMNYESIKKDEKIYFTTIANLHGFLVGGRLLGGIIGELCDRDEENKIQELTHDNESLAEQLKQAYIPSTDPKVGTS